MVAVERAIEALGGPQKTADAVGVRYQSVAAWRKKGVITSLKLAYRLSKESGIPLEDFARDLENTVGKE
jgi:hypothetical protein